MLRDSLVCKSQQQIHERSWQNQRLVIFHVLERQQLEWIDNFRKVACTWFWMEKIQVYIQKKFTQDYDKDSDKGYIFKWYSIFSKATRATQ